MCVVVLFVFVLVEDTLSPAVSAIFGARALMRTRNTSGLNHESRLFQLFR